ncbi:ropporin-1-like isoform X2 [Osmerus eperlanus]|uniref:ropporin-1-like isoform X2 n=1 Tax=Osmerus eperlanus TaxID=29151 RepID=UPI002E14DA82
MSQKGRQVVVIPPELPEILRQFTKDAIRTQPEDLLKWSTEYFGALAQGKVLPVREPTPQMANPGMDLTPEILSAMHFKMHKQDMISKQELECMWRGYGLAEDLLKHIMNVGCFCDELVWIKFFALGCSYLGGTLKNAMTHALYILNADSTCKPPDACIPFETFRSMYLYLAAVDGEVSQSQVDRALTYLETQAKTRNGIVKVSDFINSHKVRLG